MLTLLVIATTLLTAGDEAVRAGEFEAAIKAYRAYLEQEPESYRARLGVARATSFAGRWDEAIGLYTAMLEDNPDDPDARLGRGRVLAWMGAYARAEEDLLQVTSEYPHYGDAWRALGDLYFWSDRNNEALQAYDRWVEIEPRRPEAWLSRFRANRALRRFAPAREDLREAEALGGDPELIAQSRTLLDRLAWQGWELRLRYDFVAFADPRADWHTGRAAVRRDFDIGSLTVDGTVARRFDERADAVGLEGYLNLWTRAYANARVQVGFEADVLPDFDGRLSVHQGFAEIWEVSLSYRYLVFADANVNLVSAWLAVNIEDWYLRQQSLLSLQSGEVGFAFDGLARFYYGTVDDFIELQIGGGRNVVVLPRDRVELRGTFFARLELQRFFGRLFGILIAFSVVDDREVPTGWGISFGTAVRWL